MCAVVFYFPRDSKFGEYFWTLVIISTLPLVLFLIYYYAIVFQSDFLGTNLVEKHRGGRNQLSWYLALTMPYAIANFMCRYKLRPVAKIIGLLSLLVFVITWIYIGSRATWITVLCSFIVMSYDLRKLKEVFWFALIGLAGYWMLTSEMGELDARSRFIYLFDPESVPTLHSYDYRLSFLTDILGKIQESPVWGQGFMFAKNAFVYWPHNDYAAILCDLGVIGLILFFCVLAIVNFNLRQTKFSFRSSWVLLGARGSFVSVCMYSLFTDTYTTPLFWIFLGLCIVTSRGASFDLENVTKTGDYGELSQR